MDNTDILINKYLELTGRPAATLSVEEFLSFYKIEQATTNHVMIPATNIQNSISENRKGNITDKSKNLQIKEERNKDTLIVEDNSKKKEAEEVELLPVKPTIEDKTEDKNKSRLALLRSMPG